MINYLNGIVPVSAELGQYLYAQLCITPSPKKLLLVAPGQKCDKMWFLEKGAAIIYAADGHGGKVITDIVIGPGIIWLPEYSKKHCFSRHYIEVVSECEVQWFHHGEIWQELQQFKEFQFIESALVRLRSIAGEEKFMMMRENIIAERYRRCLILYPGIEKILSGKTIALFLNTTRETICRRKKR
jgi:hypothetical protein